MIYTWLRANPMIHGNPRQSTGGSHPIHVVRVHYAATSITLDLGLGTCYYFDRIKTVSWRIISFLAGGVRGQFLVSFFRKPVPCGFPVLKNN